MKRLSVDGMIIEVEDGTTILKAAERLGIRIPKLCYHGRLSVAGNCRVCLVEVEGRGDLVISCKEVAEDGMVVRTDTERVKKARADVLELILMDHPIDCPICDKAGECDLQDYYFEYSLRPRRFDGGRLKKSKALRVSPYVILDAERCVGCTRCIRFCEEIVGVHEIGMNERGAASSIGVGLDGELSNPYSMCTVDLCPVGALTSADFRFKKRTWFLSKSPTLCLGCATGCNVWLDHEDGVAYRYRPRENERVNGFMICNAGRLSYRSISSDDRVLTPLVLSRGEMSRVTWSNALSRIRERKAGFGSSEVVGVLSARSSIEENLAFLRICKELFGATSILLSGREPEPGFADSMLRDADRNPNANGVSMLASGGVDDLGPGCGWIILDGLNSAELLSLVWSRPSCVILVASNLPCGQRFADIVLPKPSHVEQDGSYVNKNGMLQVAPKAFEPIGESLPVWKIGEIIASALKLGWGMDDVDACRRWGCDNYKEYVKLGLR